MASTYTLYFLPGDTLKASEPYLTLCLKEKGKSLTWGDGCKQGSGQDQTWQKLFTLRSRPAREPISCTRDELRPTIDQMGNSMQWAPEDLCTVWCECCYLQNVHLACLGIS